MKGQGRMMDGDKPATRPSRTDDDATSADFHDQLIGCLPSLYAYAIGMTRNRDRADDLVQETVVRALTAWRQFQPGTNFKAWIFTILRNEHIAYFRKNKVTPASLDDFSEATYQAAANQDSRLILKELGAAMAKLPALQREALLLVVVYGFRYDEAAQICSCAVGTIKSRVSRARQELQAILLYDEVAAPSSGARKSRGWKTEISAPPQLAVRGQTPF